MSIAEEFAGRTKVGSATGFFYEHGGSLFFVTNRHVLCNEDEDFYPDRLRLRLHSDRQNIAKNDPADLPLYKGNAPAWLQHPTTQCDLALVEIDATLRAKYIMNSFSRANLPPQDLIVAPGEPLTALGFPLGFYDTITNIPIARTATLASPYPLPFRGEPFFLTEARLHPGTSGAPVLYLPRGIVRTKTAMSVGSAGNFLLGVHSGAFTQPMPAEPFDLNVCWFAELIEDLLTRLRPPAPVVQAPPSTPPPPQS